MADLPFLFVKILVNPKGLTAFYVSIKTKSAHDKLQSIKNAWSKDEICFLEMVALLTQGKSAGEPSVTFCEKRLAQWPAICGVRKLTGGNREPQEDRQRRK